MVDRLKGQSSRVNENEISVRKWTITCALIDPGSSECTIKAASVVILGGFEIICITSELKSFGSNHFKVKSPGIVRADITVDEVTAEGV